MISKIGYREILLSILFLFPVSLAASAQSTTNPQNAKINPVHQLRIYEIFDGNKRAFHIRFRDHAALIMAKYDFKIVAMWESKKDDRTEFVYILEWRDAATMKDRSSKFMADKEWADIKKETGGKYGPMVGEIADRTLELTEYSPRRSLLK